MSEQDADQLRGLAEAAQRAAGVLAARHRGDAGGVAALMDGFGSDRALAGGFLLLAELTLGLYGREAGRSAESCLQELCLHLSQTLDAVA